MNNAQHYAYNEKGDEQMFVVKCNDRFYGPFKTATLAVNWALAHLTSVAWEIVMLRKPT
jgi:hypothetical protein